MDDLRILTKLSEAYKIWHAFFANLPRHTRFTVGAKIDNLFTDCLTIAILAGYSGRQDKLPVVIKLSAQFDSLKCLLKILWEIKGIDNKKYIHLSAPLAEIGKMIGSWIKIIKTSDDRRK